MKVSVCLIHSSLILACLPLVATPAAAVGCDVDLSPAGYPERLVECDLGPCIVHFPAYTSPGDGYWECEGVVDPDPVGSLT